MDDHQTVIARIPNPNAGPAGLTTASEVATIDFLRDVLKIPVPKVLAWSADGSLTNPVGSEYLIMENAPGTDSGQVWPEMELAQRNRTMEDIVDIQKKLLPVCFQCHGCLYHREKAPPGSRPAAIDGESVSSSLKEEVAKRFSVGPVVATAFWEKERSHMIGPFALREIAWIKHYAVVRSPNDPFEVTFLKPFLWHQDLHLNNIFVDGSGHVTNIIDWQSAFVGSLFTEAGHPRFLRYDGEIILRLPEDYGELDADSQAEVKGKVMKSLLIYFYETKIKQDIPLLHDFLHFPNGATRTWPFVFVGSTWDGSIVPLRESLIKTERHWRELGYEFPCPIQFSKDELRQHLKDGERWNELQDFWASISHFMHRDGWTTHENYEVAATAYRKTMYEAVEETSQPP